MPHELGVFVALTGQRLSNEDMLCLGMAKWDLLTDFHSLKEDLLTGMVAHQHPGHTVDRYGNMFQWQRQQTLIGMDRY